MDGWGRGSGGSVEPRLTLREEALLVQDRDGVGEEYAYVQEVAEVVERHDRRPPRRCAALDGEAGGEIRRAVDRAIASVEGEVVRLSACGERRHGTWRL